MQEYNGFDFTKAAQALNFFARKEGGVINKMKAFKLIWLSERLHLRLYGRPIINDIYFAIKLGPIPSSTKNIAEGVLDTEEEVAYRNACLVLNGHNIESKSEVDTSVFSQTDIKAMEVVYEKFHNLNQFLLSDLSHIFPEWKKFEGAISSGFAKRFQMSYNDFFSDPQINNPEIFQQSPAFLEMSKEYFNGYC